MKTISNLRQSVWLKQQERCNRTSDRGPSCQEDGTKGNVSWPSLWWFWINIEIWFQWLTTYGETATIEQIVAELDEKSPKSSGFIHRSWSRNVSKIENAFENDAGDNLHEPKTKLRTFICHTLQPEYSPGCIFLQVLWVTILQDLLAIIKRADSFSVLFMAWS